MLIRMPTFVLVSLFFYCSKLWSIILSSLWREKLSKEMWKKPLNMLTKSLKVSGPGLKKKSKGSEVEDSVSAGLRNTEPPKQCFCIPE